MFFKMEKFLKVAVTGLGDQLVSISNVKLIDEASATATATTIHYMDGTTTTITHAADTAFSVLLALQTAMASALQSDWKKVTHDVTLSVAVSQIANA
jgi:hypothetical protein